MGVESWHDRFLALRTDSLSVRQEVFTGCPETWTDPEGWVPVSGTLLSTFLLEVTMSGHSKARDDRHRKKRRQRHNAAKAAASRAKAPTDGAQQASSATTA